MENKKINEVLDSQIITNMLDIVQKDTYQIVSAAFEVMIRHQPIEHISEFDKTKNYIFELFHKDKKIKHNLIYLSKILFFSSHRIKNYRKEIIPKYKTILKIIKQLKLVIIIIIYAAKNVEIYLMFCSKIKVIFY